jgi:hypothetical protein
LLTAESYETAWIAYGAATAGAVVILYFWVGNRLSRGLRLSLALMLAVLALTPAHPAPDIQTWAPAVVVAGFELLSSGLEAALRPLRSLLIAEALLLVVCVLVWLVLGRLRRE